MEKWINADAVNKALDRIREEAWLHDIPSPTVPEYIEHHETMQRLMIVVDKERKQLEDAADEQPTLCGYNIEHLELIARVLQKENLPPERIVEVLTDIGRIVSIVRDEFEESLRKAVEQCKINELPPADVAPVRHGEWADDASCPFCGFKPWYENDIHTLSFCPNCGAKMDGGDGE